MLDSFGWFVALFANIDGHAREDQGSKKAHEPRTHVFGNGRVAMEIRLVPFDDAVDPRCGSCGNKESICGSNGLRCQHPLACSPAEPVHPTRAGRAVGRPVMWRAEWVIWLAGP